MQELPGKLAGVRASGSASRRQPPFPELRFLETHPTAAPVLEATKQWGKAFVLTTTSGSNITPIRPSWVCTSSHPDHLPRKCPFNHCKLDGCKGNRIERSRDGSYTMVIEHHKTSGNSRWAEHVGGWVGGWVAMHSLAGCAPSHVQPPPASQLQVGTSMTSPTCACIRALQ